MMAAPQSLLALIAGMALAAPTALADEIDGANGRVVLVYDNAIWDGRLSDDGLPELACKAEGCGGNTAGCGTVIVSPEGEPLSAESFENGFRENLGDSATASAAENGGSDPAIMRAASVETLGGKSGVSLSMRVTFDGHPTRVDHFWLQAGADLVGITCIVSEDRYERAETAFQQIFADARVGDR